MTARPRRLLGSRAVLRAATFGVALLLAAVGGNIAAGQATAPLAPGDSPGAKDSPGTKDATGAKEQADDAKFFEAQVRPLLAEHCWKCHGPEKQKGGLRLDVRDAAMRGGESGPAIVPGKPDESLLVEAVRHEGLEMPPTGKLPDEKIAVLERWIARGAHGLSLTAAEAAARSLPGRSITDIDRAWWAFQPIGLPQPPELDDAGWCRNEVDRFVLAKLRAEGLEPAAEADRRTLIRRLYLDVTGLPPSPDEVDAFVRDGSPGAYEHVVDRLLASPHYGQRWGRHWLDLVRYAESDGYKADFYRPNAWRYRDYVIQSFNDDKPFDRFVLEQLAADEALPDEPALLVATGYLRLGIYEYNNRDIRTQWANILNDITDVTGEVFLGMGVGCARCHDHKFDPILQKDYYRLQSFFAALLPRDDLTTATPEERAAYQERLGTWEEQTADVRAKIAAIEEPHQQRSAADIIKKFTPDLQAMYAKPVEERTPTERQLTYMMARQSVEEGGKPEKRIKGEQRKTWQALKDELAAQSAQPPEPLPGILAVTDTGREAPATVIPGKRDAQPIDPGYLSVLDERPAEILPMSSSVESTGRRTALARWLTSPENPLTARVLANRIWQYHFGRGLVSTASDFGHLGDRPSHPELLDWLARELAGGGWRMKRLHRLVLTSATYRQTATRPAPEAARLKDPENRWLWRMNVRRLDAEQVRDAMLAASGELDRQLGGPAVEGDSLRRSVYLQVKRNTPDPLLAAFDVTDGITSCAARNCTTTPTQALLLVNGAWTLARAKALAERVRQASPSDRAARVRAAYRFALDRLPSAAEFERAARFLAEGPAVVDSAAASSALVDLCHVLLNSNEFLYAD